MFRSNSTLSGRCEATVNEARTTSERVRRNSPHGAEHAPSSSNTARRHPRRAPCRPACAPDIPETGTSEVPQARAGSRSMASRARPAAMSVARRCPGRGALILTRPAARRRPRSKGAAAPSWCTRHSRCRVMCQAEPRSADPCALCPKRFRRVAQVEPWHGTCLIAARDSEDAQAKRSCRRSTEASHAQRRRDAER
jgi:hypothetical protein